MSYILAKGMELSRAVFQKRRYLVRLHEWIGYKKTYMMLSVRKFVSCRDTRASRKGLLDGARDPFGFNAGIIDPAHSSRDVPVNLTLQLTRRES